MSEAELRRRIVALELAVDRLTVELSELKARPQPTYSFGGAGNYWPWSTGSVVRMELPKGANGAAGPMNVSRETLED